MTLHTQQLIYKCLIDQFMVQLHSESHIKIMDSSAPSPQVVENSFGYVKLYSDGSIFRSNDIKHRNTIHDDGSAIWKDRLFDREHNLYVRLYKPKNASTDSNKKLPIVYYLHAGGFVFGDRAYPNTVNTCLSLSSGLQALVISPDFRLAPEHRLPAALKDVYSAVKWLQIQALSDSRDPWLSDGVDLDRVFIFGDSSGGNMAHHLAVQLGPGSPDLRPIRIRGYILLSPFFGGTVRTKREIERPCEDFWTQELFDQFWRLAIPNGANTDHPLVNPFGPESPSLEGVSLDPMLVLVGGDEVMKDRVHDYGKRMKQLNHDVDYVEFRGKQHGFFTSYSYLEEAKNVIQVFQRFLSENSK